MCKSLETYSQVILSQLKPIADSLDYLQSDNVTIDEACRVLLTLLKEDCLQTPITEFSKRMNQSMQPFHFLVYLVNPKYRRKSLSIIQKESAHSCISEIS